MVAVVNELSKIIFHNIERIGSNPVKDDMKIHNDTLRIPFIAESR